MISRRKWLGTTLGAGAALALDTRVLGALERLSARELITRAIPGSGERLPVVGLGSSATFAQVARSEDVSAIRAVLARLHELGGRAFDTAPGYGASEEVAGEAAQRLGIAQDLFWATKLNVAPPGSQADPAAARVQLAASFQRIGTPAIDLIQIHNMGDLATQLPILREAKEEGRVRYIGVTTTFEPQYEGLLQVMRTEPIDFIGIDYAVDNRAAEETFLPLARDRGIAVMVYMPFGRTRLWNRVAGKEVPSWAEEFDAHSWAQFFLKYVGSHPDVTVITPATSRPENMADNMGGAMGRLPDEATRRRMAQFVDTLPSA